MMVNLPCLKGSDPNFLRPTCSYTECSLSFLTGSCPTERTTASYSSCLYLDFTDLPVPQGTDIPWTLTLSRYLLVIVLMQYLLHSIVIGFLSRTLPDSEFSGTRQGSGINNAVDCLTLQSLPSFPDV